MLKTWRSGNRSVRSLTHFHARSLGADSWCGSAGDGGGSSASVPGSLCRCLPPPLPPLLGTGSSCYTSLVQWQQSRTLRCWSGHSPGGRKAPKKLLSKGLQVLNAARIIMLENRAAKACTALLENTQGKCTLSSKESRWPENLFYILFALVPVHSWPSWPTFYIKIWQKSRGFPIRVFPKAIHLYTKF